MNELEWMAYELMNEAGIHLLDDPFEAVEVGWIVGCVRAFSCALSCHIVY